MDDFEEGRLLRIFVDEQDRRGAQPLYTAVVEELRAAGVLGATVFRGIEGYGSHGQIHAGHTFSWIPNLPILIEVIDRPERIEALLPRLRSVVAEGTMTIEPVRYLHLGSARTALR